MGRTRKLQTFTRSKDYRLPGVGDVTFLMWPAVERIITAPCRNHAYNALLFMFCYVLGKEFGKVDGIVRAKRKPYIPVMLSGDETDRFATFLDHPYGLVTS